MKIISQTELSLHVINNIKEHKQPLWFTLPHTLALAVHYRNGVNTGFLEQCTHPPFWFFTSFSHKADQREGTHSCDYSLQGLITAMQYITLKYIF